jgi:predicted transcriptional regulator of viral defense system
MTKETRKTYRERLLEVARERHGFVTTTDARELGIPIIELRKLAHRGKLEHVSRGVYQFPLFGGSMNESYLRATLRVGSDAYLTADAVLAFHDLALVNPRTIRVGANRRVRHNLPKQIEVRTQQVPEDQIEIRDGIRTTRVAKAIVDCKGIVMKGRLMDALDEAIERGLVTSAESSQVRLAFA